MRSDGMICGMSDENSFAAVASSAMTMPWILTCSRATKNVDSFCKGLLCPGHEPRRVKDCISLRTGRQQTAELLLVA